MDHRDHTARDTVFALSTGMGRAALAVIRVTGPGSGESLTRLAGAVPQPRTASLRTLRAADGSPIDQALVLFFAGPESFTGEDVAEFHVHGGPAVVGALLRELAAIPGLRPAPPGEFTRRALLNGKLDLTQAEAVGDLIDSDTDRQRLQALRQYGGALAGAVDGWKTSLVEALALIEAELDFSDEHDVAQDVTGPAASRVATVLPEINRILQSTGGERIRDGITVVVAGPPNAGKSTLLNWWAGREAAIVTAVPGTTRDLIEVDLDLAGIPVRLVDTAGLRTSEDPVEQIGVERARARAASADLVLWLHPECGEIEDALAHLPCLRLQTKIDSAPERSRPEGWMGISVHSGEGLAEVRHIVQAKLAAAMPANEGLITRARHRLALRDAADHLERAVAGVNRGGPLEFLAEDIRLAVRSLDVLVGRVGPEDVLDQLFSSFCIGK